MRAILLRDAYRVVAGQAGFTLLELLVVLVVLGATTSLAGPELWHSYERAREQSVVRGYGEAVLDLRLKVLHTGRAVTLSLKSGDSLLSSPAGKSETVPAFKDLVLPEDWSIERFDTLFLLPSGVTNGGSIVLTAPTAHRWQLTIHTFDGHMEVKRL